MNYRTLIAMFCTLGLAFCGCDKDKDRERESKPERDGKAEKQTHGKYEKQGIEAVKTLQVAGKYSGRWESGTHKGHGGGLDCLVTEAGAGKWDAVFTAEFGKIKDYKIKLEGKPEGSKVVFGGKVDLGKDDGGIFTWTGHADEKEFIGQYEGGGDKGTFKMARK